MQVTSGPTSGQAIVNGDGSITYTPPAAFVGIAFFTYRVCDNDATPLCATAAVTVTVNALPNQPPVAVDDSATTQQGKAVTVAVLNNDDDPDGALNPSSVQVQSGPISGQTIVNGNGSITYTPAGAFVGNDSFAYQVCDNDAAPLCATAAVTITVTAPPNQPPLAVNDSAITQQGQAVVVNVLSNDDDPDGTLDPASVQVTSGPTSGQTGVNGDGSITYTPTLSFIGNDTFTYQVCDDGITPLCASATVFVKVSPPPNQPPVAADDRATTLQGQAVVVNVLSNDDDPDGTLDPTSVQVTSGPTSGQTGVNGDGSITYTPALSLVGNDSFIYQVCDEHAPPLCDMATVSITVTVPPNEPPVAVDDSATTQQEAAVIIAVLSNDDDPDGALDPASVQVTSGPTSGQTGVNGNGSITYTPALSFIGNDTFTYQVCDDDSTPLCDTATVTVRVNALPNEPPVAVDDTVTTQRGTAVTISLLSNDSDPDGALDPSSVKVTSGPTSGLTGVNGNGSVTYTPSLSFIGNDSFTYQVCDNDVSPLCATATVSITVTVPPNQPPIVVDDSATTQQDQAVTVTVLKNDDDADGSLDPDSVQVTSGPTHGQATVNGNGSVTYRPDAAFVGSDSFTYQVCDDDATPLCDSATVSVRVNAPPNQPPVTVDDSATTEQGNAVTVMVLANDDDPDGALDPASVQIKSGPTNGQAGVNVDGSITYMPSFTFVGKDSFTYEVCDGDTLPLCGSARVDVTVNTPPNEPPVALDDTVTTLREKAVSVPVMANDTDPDGTLDPASVQVTGEPTSGVTRLNGDGSITYTPAVAFIGKDTFTYQICDKDIKPLCDTATVYVTVNAPPNKAPTAVDDEAVTLVARAVTIDILDNDVDPDGALEPTSVQVTSDPSNGQADVNGDGSITYRPGATFVGKDSFTYAVCDNDAKPLCDTATVSITVNAPPNSPPTAVDDEAVTRVDQAVIIAVLDNDVDRDGQLVAASLVIRDAAQHGLATVVNGTIEYQPAAGYIGEDRFTYTVCDDGDPPACDHALVIVTINPPPNLAPIALDDVVVTRPGQTRVINVLANDVDWDGQLVPSSLRIRGTVAPGTAEVGGGAITYVADSTFVGTVRFEYEVCDDGTPSACAVAVVLVNVSAAANLPPVAVDDAISTLPGRSVDIAVLANDIDVDGGLNPSSLSILTPAAHGLVELNDGVVRYSPDPNFSGADQFVYQVCDTSTPMACASATVRITVLTASAENEAYAFNDAGYVLVGQSVSGNVLDNDLDPEGDGWQTPTVVTAPVYGTVDLGADGTYTYQADSSFVGNDSWIYRVCDRGQPEQCVGAIVVITVVRPNATPQARDDMVVTRVNRVASGALLVNDSDPDGNTLVVDTTPLVGPNAGQLLLTPAGIFTYVPNRNFTGSDSFTYQACDPGGLCDDAAVTIAVLALNIANGAPYARDDYAVVRPGTSTALHVLANDGDIDDALNVPSVSIIDQPTRGSTEPNVDGTITYHAPTTVGTASFRYRVCDIGLPPLCASAEVTVEIVANGANATYAFEDAGWGEATRPLRGNVLDNDLDPEGDGQRVELLTSAPTVSHGQLTLAPDGHYTYIADSGYLGTDQFSYRVCDDGQPQACSEALVTLHLFPPNLGWDFGDASNFPTKLAADGPRHALMADLRLGDLLDVEADGLHNAAATTDDQTDLNDEAIVANYPSYDHSGSYHLEIPVTNLTPYSAQLVGWIDWNRDLAFDDPGERSLPALDGEGIATSDATDDTFVTANIPAGFSGTVRLTWQGFGTPESLNLKRHLRLRLASNLPGSETFFTDSGPSVTGSAVGGSVIDSLALIPPQAERVEVRSFQALAVAAVAESLEVDFTWITALEENVDGFNLLVANGDELTPVNAGLIPSLVTSSTTETPYTYRAPTEGNLFYLQIVMRSGETILHGPISLVVLPPAEMPRYLPFVLSTVDE